MRFHPLVLGFSIGLIMLVGILVGWFSKDSLLTNLAWSNTDHQTQSSEQIPTEPEKPLLDYTIPALRAKQFGQAQVTVLPNQEAQQDAVITYIYSAQTLGKTMTGVVTSPSQPEPDAPIIIMLRGYVPLSMYQPGVGTKSAANALAKQGFITIAPDFFGYGGSDPESDDVWQSRFEKPIVVIELLNALENRGLNLPTGDIQPRSVGLWGHSNGGQIALTTLTILERSIPTSLWAPVSAPFPYNILYFTDEEEDEGQASRKWLALFEERYDARLFSFTNYLDGLHGPIQIHQGTNDDAVLQWWSTEFTEKLEVENQKRKLAQPEMKNIVVNSTTLSSESGTLVNESDYSTNDTTFDPIKYELYLYPGANHNLTPGWNQVMDRDVAFFKSHLWN